MPGFVSYIPIATTAVALAFSAVLFARWRAKGGGPHLLWWAIGTLTYAAGTITESATTLLGWHEPVFRAWYITGALLGGAPLAQGSVYLHLPRRTANALSVALVMVIVVASTCVILSPVDYALVEPFRLTGKVLTWRWVRAFSPFINMYALVFLAGGAAYSAWRYARRQDTWHRFVGNTYIAIGAVLPGIGGTFTRFGHTEVLYVTEFIGLAMIFAGYRACTFGAVLQQNHGFSRIVADQSGSISG
ncbi:MAG: hypothetical protein ACHQQ3_09065 [Gemmatimonadales bacterium]